MSNPKAYGLFQPLPEELRSEEGIAMAVDLMKYANSMPELRMLIEDHEKAERDWTSRLSDAREEGLAAGKAEGEALGKAEGRAEALRQSLRLVAESRLGPLTPELSRKLEALDDPARLEQLMKTALLASALEDIERLAD